MRWEAIAGRCFQSDSHSRTERFNRLNIHSRVPSTVVTCHAGYDVTLSSIRGGSIPFETASLEPTDASYKIVQRFFDDGADPAAAPPQRLQLSWLSLTSLSHWCRQSSAERRRLCIRVPVGGPTASMVTWLWSSRF